MTIAKYERIISIEPFEDNDHSGYKVTTNKQVIEFGIDNHQDCCEQWGYFTSNDNLSDFLKAKLLEVSVVDKALKTEYFLKQCEEEGCSIPDDKYSDSYMMFVNITTSKGVLQFVAYNEHNGYYGHEAYIKSNQLTESTTL